LTKHLINNLNVLAVTDLSEKRVIAPTEKELLTNLLTKKANLFKNLMVIKLTSNVQLETNQIDNINLLIKNSIMTKIVKRVLLKEDQQKDLNVQNLLKMTA